MITRNDKTSTACIFINTRTPMQSNSNSKDFSSFFFSFHFFDFWNMSQPKLTRNKWKQDAGHSYWRRRLTFNSWWLRRRQPEHPSSVFTPSIRQPTETMTSPFSSLSALRRQLANQQDLHPVVAVLPANVHSSFLTLWRESSPSLLTFCSRSTSHAIKVMHRSYLHSFWSIWYRAALAERLCYASRNSRKYLDRNVRGKLSKQSHPMAAEKKDGTHAWLYAKNEKRCNDECVLVSRDVRVDLVTHVKLAEISGNDDWFSFTGIPKQANANQ